MGTNYKAIHLPVGYEVAIKTATDPDWIDLGVTMNEGSLEFSYDAVKITGSQAEPVLNYMKNMIMNASFTLLQQELSNINRLMSGATAYNSVAADPVAVTDETTASGIWALNQFLPFKNQNGTGTVPTSISVDNGEAELARDTDYIVAKSGNKWGIIVLDTATTDIAENILIDYTYTPSAKRILTAGSSSVDIHPYQVRIRKLLDADAGKYWTVYLYAGVNTAGLTFSLPRYDADEPSVLEVAIEGQLDTSRSHLDQLFRIEDEYGIEDID